MKIQQSYAKPLMWLSALLMTAVVAGCGGGGKDPILGGSVTAVLGPMVTSTTPLARTPMVTGVAVNSKVTATFSKEMAPATITDSTFTLACPAASAVTGTVSYAESSRIATFSPADNLPVDTTCVATVTTGAKDLAGNPLATNFIWSFKTGLTSDTTAPQLLNTSAVNGATNLPVNRDSTATFTEPMEASTLINPPAYTVKETVSGNPVPGVVTYSDIGNTATFNPDSNLTPGTQYTSTISVNAKDLAGNALTSGTTPNPWVWTTAALPGPVADSTPPEVNLTNPADLATNVPVDSIINATFSEEMRQSTMITANYTVKTAAGVDVPGTVAYDVQNDIATFNPLVNLDPDTSYTVEVSNNATDLAGNTLVVPPLNGLPKPNPWTFRTAATSVPVAPLAINLRSAVSFGIASRAGLTSTGVTVINGDVALYPTPTCTDSTGNLGASQTCLVKTYVSPTGMSVNGSIYWAGDPFDNGGTALAVTNDLNIAWSEGRNKVDTQGAIPADQMGGNTFLSGVYHNANLGLAAGTVATLDAQGDQNAVFIFKVDSDFTDSGTLNLPTRIDLRNGALARNVWFVTGRDITIGSGTSWNGNILAGRDVTVKDGSTVIGRVLGGAAGAGAVVLTGAASPSVTTITVPQ